MLRRTATSIERKQLSRLIEQACARPIRSRSPGIGGRRPGFDPSHIKTLDDLWRAPFYTVDDIRKSIDDAPALR